MFLVYVIMQNDGLMVENAFQSFEDAADVVFEKTGFCPLTANHLYEVSPMNFVRIYQLEILKSN